MNRQVALLDHNHTTHALRRELMERDGDHRGPGSFSGGTHQTLHRGHIVKQRPVASVIFDEEVLCARVHVCCHPLTVAKE